MFFRGVETTNQIKIAMNLGFIFVWKTIPLDCAIYRLPLRSMCNEKGERERERRKDFNIFNYKFKYKFQKKKYIYIYIAFI